MRYLLFCLLLSCLLPAPGFAQSSRPTAYRRLTAEEKQRLRSQPLLVMLQRDDPQQLKKLARNPAGLRAYRDDMAKSNAILRRAAAVWTFSPSVEFRYADEIDSLAMTDGVGQLNVLDFDQVAHATSPTTAARSWDKPGTGPSVGGTASLPSFRLRVYIKKRNFALHSEPILGPTLLDSDLTYCTKMIEQNVAGTAWKRTKSGPNPPTLLLCQDDRAADLTDTQIKQVYPYPYQFVARAEYEKAFQAATPGYALVRMCWQGYAIISPMVLTLPNLELVCGGDLHSLKQPLITQKDFKSFKKTLLQ